MAAVVGGRLSAAEYRTLADVPKGCYNYGYVFTPAMANISTPFLENSAPLCQARCAATVGCASFGYWTTNKQCWLGGDNGELIASQTIGAISGPATCTAANRACKDSDLPGPGFPGASVNDSRAAWPLGQQPTNLQCWPRKENGFPASCWAETAMVLEDSELGWPGRCDGMMKITNLAANESCQSRCFGSPLCAVWAIENASSGDGSLTCWQSIFGSECYDPSSGVQVPPGTFFRSQRIMHGSFRVLMSAADMHIKKLTKVFGVKHHPEPKAGAKACRMVCLSVLLCQYWQYSTSYGCHVEDGKNATVAYPLVYDDVNLANGTYEATTFKFGEYIQHTCEPGPRQPLPFDPPGGPSKLITAQTFDRPIGQPAALPVVNNKRAFPMWASTLITVTILAVLSVMAAAVYMTILDADKKGMKGMRGAEDIPYFMRRPGVAFPVGPSSRVSSFDSQSHLMSSHQGAHQSRTAHLTHHAPAHHFGWDFLGHHRSYQPMGGTSHGQPTHGAPGYPAGPTRDQLMQYAHQGY